MFYLYLKFTIPTKIPFALASLVFLSIFVPIAELTKLPKSLNMLTNSICVPLMEFLTWFFAQEPDNQQNQSFQVLLLIPQKPQTERCFFMTYSIQINLNLLSILYNFTELLMIKGFLLFKSTNNNFFKIT